MTDYCKEHIVIGDEAKMQETIDYWCRRHINAVVYRRHWELFSGRLCDVGCNIGMASLLAATDPGVEYVLGLDVYLPAIEAARRYRTFFGLRQKIEYRVADFTKPCPFIPSASFDGVISFHTLEHIYVEDLDPFLGNVHRILKPDGVVFVSIPYKTAHNDPTHQSWFDGVSLHDLFVQNRFRHIAIEVDGGAILTGIFEKEVGSVPFVLP